MGTSAGCRINCLIARLLGRSTRRHKSAILFAPLFSGSGQSFATRPIADAAGIEPGRACAGLADDLPDCRSDSMKPCARTINRMGSLGDHQLMTAVGQPPPTKMFAAAPRHPPATNPGSDGENVAEGRPPALSDRSVGVRIGRSARPPTARGKLVIVAFARRRLSSKQRAALAKDAPSEPSPPRTRLISNSFQRSAAPQGRRTSCA